MKPARTPAAGIRAEHGGLPDGTKPDAVLPQVEKKSEDAPSPGKRIARPAPHSVVCILGMHRSGTSCLAGCLEERGLQLGEVINASPYNQKGNKESLQVRAINDDVLALSGGSWDRPPKRLKWNNALRRRRDKHIAKHRAYQIWGFKDPRTVLTLPFWLEGRPDMRFIGTFRHPQAVAQSLMRRPGLQPALPPGDLWQHYNRTMLEHVGQFRFPLVCFDWPAAAYVRGIGEVARYLGLQDGPDAAVSYFQDELRSGHSSAGEDRLSDEDMSIYEELMKSAVDVGSVRG